MKIDEQVRAMSPPRYTRSQAAQIVGRSADTLVRWRDEGLATPSDHKFFGSTKVDLYTQDDLAVLKNLARTIRSGRSKSNV